MVISVTQPVPDKPDTRAGRRRRENTRARLLDAALAVFAEKGVRRVTVDDLVGAAGFTRGAFYSNFDSIEQVFFALFDQQSRRMLATVRETVDAIPDGEFSLDSIGRILDSLRPFGRDWYLIQAEFTSLAVRNEQAREVFTEHHRQFEQEMQDLVTHAVARLGRVPTVPAPQLAETLIGLYQHALAQEHLGTGALDTRALVDTVLPQVVLGLSRPAED